MNPHAQGGMNAPPNWSTPLYQRYLRLQEWSCANDYRLPTYADMQYLRFLSGFDNARIVYFLSDHTLAYIATRTAWEADTSDEAPSNSAEGDGLLTGSTELSRILPVTPREDGPRAHSVSTNVGAGASSMFGILDGNHYYSIGNGVLDESVESPTMSDLLENRDRRHNHDEPSSTVQQHWTQSTHFTSANDDSSSDLQVTELSTTISETVPECSQVGNSDITEASAIQASGTMPSSASPQEPPSNLRSQSPDPDSQRRSFAQMLLDIYSNPRPSLPSPQPLLEHSSLLEQPLLPSAASSPQTTLPQEGPLDREEYPTPVSEEAYTHLANVRVAMVNAEAGAFTAAQRNFLLDSFARSSKDFTIGLAKTGDDRKCKTEESTAHVEVISGHDCMGDKEQPPMKLQKEISVEREDGAVNDQFLELENTKTDEESPMMQPVMTDPVSSGSQKILEEGDLEMRDFRKGDADGQALVVQDDMVTIEGVESDSFTMREKRPLIRPIFLKPTAVISQKQINMKDSEHDSYRLAVGMPRGPSEILALPPWRNLPFYPFLSSLAANREPRAGPPADAVSAAMDGTESDTSSLEAKSAEQHSSQEQSVCADEGDESPTLLPLQSHVDVQISDLSSRLSYLARQISIESSPLESLTVVDDVSGRMAWDSGGGPVGNAVDVAARNTATVAAWCRALSAHVNGEDEDGSGGEGD